MARIRTIKPEFWEDDVIGCLTRDERLLFIATWTAADDEGLLRWTPAYLKAAAFMYDDDVDLVAVERMMMRLAECGLIFPYKAGKAHQSFAYIINFHKHQRINRPSPSRLLPPSLMNPSVREMYAQRDGWKCHLCGGDIDERVSSHGEEFCASCDHLKPVAEGGTDHPSNIRVAHQTCNKGRGNRSVEAYRQRLREGKTAAQFRYPERFTETLSECGSEPLSEGSPQERKGREREKDTPSETPPPAGVDHGRAGKNGTGKDLDALLFDRGKALLGKNAGGQIRKLRDLVGTGPALTIIEAAERKQDPAEWIAAAIRNHTKKPLPAWSTL